MINRARLALHLGSGKICPARIGDVSPTKDFRGNTLNIIEDCGNAPIKGKMK